MTVANLWVTKPQSNPSASLRLFVFPYAGGGTAIFHTWYNELPEEIELCLIHLPGREMRITESPLNDLTVMVRELSSHLQSFLDKPFAFFGHSMGAMVAFELARHLRKLGISTPKHLFMSGRRAPQIPSTEPSIHALHTDAFIQKLQQLNSTPESMLNNSELLQLLLPTIRADIQMCETYVYQGDDPLDCSITVFGGIQDQKAKYEELKAWEEQTDDSFKLYMVPGDHFFLTKSMSIILKLICKDLNQEEYGQSILIT